MDLSSLSDSKSHAFGESDLSWFTKPIPPNLIEWGKLFKGWVVDHIWQWKLWEREIRTKRGQFSDKEILREI